MQSHWGRATRVHHYLFQHPRLHPVYTVPRGSGRVRRVETEVDVYGYVAPSPTSLPPRNAVGGGCTFPILHPSLDGGKRRLPAGSPGSKRKGKELHRFHFQSRMRCFWNREEAVFVPREKPASNLDFTRKVGDKMNLISVSPRESCHFLFFW